MLAITRANGDRRSEVAALQCMGLLRLAQGDAQAARQWHAQALALYQNLDDPLGRCEAAACAAP